MYGYHVVAVFDSYDAADRARRQLRSAGVDEDHIHLSHDSPYEEDERQPEGFWDWLFGGGGSGRDSDWYRKNLAGGRTALSVLVPDDHDHIWVAEQLVRCGALDLEDEEDPSVTADTIRQGRRGGEAADWGSEGRNWGQGGEERVIPIVNEELDVGKRQTVNRYRVRAHTVERPVEQDVNLRDERAVIERRPATGARANLQDWQDRDYEVVERHEEPDVRKRARAEEEVVIRKDVRERTEKVRDKVRQTQVETEGRGDEGRRMGRQ
jgi:stress response protein YsnF